MENSRSFKRDFSKKSYSELCGILFSKSFANEVLGSDTDGFSEPAATKLLSIRMQAILNSLKEKKIKVDDVDKTVDDMVKLFKAEAFSNAAANYSKEELLKYFKLEKNESLDDEELDKLIRFFVENLGAQFYIQGVIDSYKYIVEKSDDLRFHQRIRQRVGNDSRFGLHQTDGRQTEPETDAVQRRSVRKPE